MFKTYCGDCGNSWYIGNPRTCTCPWKDALKPEWVGLTDEEMQSIAFESADALSAVFVAVAKLKEKNT